MGDHVHDGVVHAGPHVERLESASLELNSEVDGPHDVGYVGQIPPLAPVSQNLDGLVLLDGPLERLKRQIGTTPGSTPGSVLGFQD